jgi:hypothetical protein
MKPGITRGLAALVATVGITAGSAMAQPLHLQPASVLVFPLFDSRPATATILNVTNTNENRVSCNNGFRQGDVLLHYVYVGLDTQDPNAVCLEFDRFEPLTPADTITVLASEHNPEGAAGFLVVSSLDPESAQLIDFDFLIGSAYVANSSLDIMWSYTPAPFQAVAASPVSTDNCGRDVIVAGTSPIRFDGTDYATFPDKLFIDSFFQEKNGIFSNRLTLMSTHGQDYINELDVFMFDNEEDKFSRTFKFTCWTSVKMSDISSVAKNLGGSDEFRVGKKAPIMTGWAILDGRRVLDRAGNLVENDPDILGVFTQTILGAPKKGALNLNAGHMLHYTGSQNAVLFD